MNPKLTIAALAALQVALATPVSLAAERSGTKRLHKEAVVTASLDAVWHAWTTSEGIASFFSPESNIELRIGGPYELFMSMTEPDESGLRGSEGCKVLSFIPREMLSFEWSFPPKVPTLRNAHAKTHVVLRFEELPGGKVRVRFDQLGWKDGADWDAGYAYFDKAWSWVLANLQKHFEEKGDSASSAGHGGGAEPKVKTWRDGHVTVTSVDGADKRQDFEIVVPVSVETVWDALATTEGFRKVLAPKAEIELRPGGRYAIWPGATNKVLSFVPMEMLSTSGSAPPQFPNVRKGGTWSAYFFEPVDSGHTKLRLTCVGWQEGKEWDDAFDYFLKNSPVFLNALYDRLVKVGKRSGAKGDDKPKSPNWPGRPVLPPRLEEAGHPNQQETVAPVCNR